jgi:hypothetical protein
MGNKKNIVVYDDILIIDIVNKTRINFPAWTGLPVRNFQLF